MLSQLVMIWRRDLFGVFCGIVLTNGMKWNAIVQLHNRATVDVLSFAFL